MVPVWAKGLNTMLSASAGHPPRSLFLFKILKPQTGNDARAHYLQYLAMPALVRKRGHRCPRPLFTAFRDARASRHGCHVFLDGQSWVERIKASGKYSVLCISS